MTSRAASLARKAITSARAAEYPDFPDYVAGRYLGLPRQGRRRLRHISHLGVQTFGFAYGLSDRAVPAKEVRVEITGPDSSAWSWRPEGSENSVTGPAVDFCLVVTRRRHGATPTSTSPDWSRTIGCQSRRRSSAHPGPDTSPDSSRRRKGDSNDSRGSGGQLLRVLRRPPVGRT